MAKLEDLYDLQLKDDAERLAIKARMLGRKAVINELEDENRTRQALEGFTSDEIDRLNAMAKADRASSKATANDAG